MNNYIIHTAAFIPMTGEGAARGKSLFFRLRILKNIFIVVENDRISKISRKKPALNLPVVDHDGYLLPPFANCHTHLQLSGLSNNLVWGQGFTAWLKSLVACLLERPSANSAAIYQACTDLRLAGTGYVGDIGGTIPNASEIIFDLCEKKDIHLRAFQEKFGFGKINNDYHKAMIPSGHALYSTHPDTLKRVKRYCLANRQTFTMHLAESREEEDLLCSGRGPLYDFYRDLVLSENWLCPGLSPTRYADDLGLLDEGTLLVHGVHLRDEEIKLLERRRVSLCLCPRSNHYLNVGASPVNSLANSNILLCLGTDGLTSCPDLNVANDAAWLMEHFDLPINAIARISTVNGTEALGFRFEPLAEGAPARFGYLNFGI